MKRIVNCKRCGKILSNDDIHACQDLVYDQMYPKEPTNEEIETSVYYECWYCRYPGEKKDDQL